MNFEFSEEQNILRDQAQSFLRDNCTLAQVRNVYETEAEYDKNLWEKISQLGWTGSIIPEAYGGAGLGHLELCVLAEELGRVIAPLPFSSSVYLATQALLLAGTDEQKKTYLPGLADGSLIGCIAVAESVGHTTSKSMQTVFDNGCITGIKQPVADGMIADFSIVLAGDGETVTAYIVDLCDVERTPLNSIDPSRPQASVCFNEVSATQLGGSGEGWTLLQSVYDRAAVLFAWEQVGGASAALDMAIDYAKSRFAFGRPIASFQAIKHKLAQAYVKNTLARSNCYYGAWALAANNPELSIAAASSRISAIQAYYYISKENIQTHGGVGFTWEFDCHLYYRRSKVLAGNIGSQNVWQDKLIAAISAQKATLT